MSGPAIVLAAGGTGGHVFPARATAEALLSRGARVGWVVDDRALDRGGFPDGVRMRRIAAATLSPRQPLKAPLGLWRIAKGVAAARGLIRDLGASVGAGFGGYPSLPGLVAGRLNGAKLVVHEQNAVLGRVNRLFADHAALIATSFANTRHTGLRDSVQLVGNPVRQAVTEAAGAPYAAPQDGPVRVLVLGGSLGARLLGRVVPQAIARLPEALRFRLELAQQAREEDLDAARAVYAEAGVSAICQAFFDDAPARIAQAHFVIARAGASTVAELAAIGRPALFAPLAIAMDAHQTHNAQMFVDAGAGDILAEAEFQPAPLAAVLKRRLTDPDDLARRAANARKLARTQAADRLAETLIDLAQAAQDEARS
ncbi:MAG: undecaprenyldiphospho-muramoylpentapeptide beta-N-acetylglucosaminyltransferase [Maricaulaceae bacterium]